MGYFPDIGHDKYYVFMGFSKDFKTANVFFINSELPVIAIRNPDIMKLQININPGSYNFLKKSQPSYIDCKGFYLMDSHIMFNGLIENPSKICGSLTTTHYGQIKHAVQNSRLFSVEEKNIFVAPLILPPYLCPISTLL